MQCAWAATRKQDSVFRVRFQRLAPRRGEKRAIVAVAHLMLLILYSMLKEGASFRGAESAPKQRRRQTSCSPSLTLPSTTRPLGRDHDYS